MLNLLRFAKIAIALSFVQILGAQGALTPGTAPFLAFQAPVVALQHIRVIDGTGAPARADQTVVIDHGRIAALGDSASTAIPAGARVVDGSGRTVFPGLIGMHEHISIHRASASRSTMSRRFRRRAFIWLRV